jgi:leucyl aminopeptidase
MRVRVRRGDLRAAAADFVIVPLAGGEESGSAVRALARHGGGAAVRQGIAAARFHGREGQVTTLALAGPRRRTLCLVGLGDAKTLDVDAWRRAAGRGRTAADAAGARRVAIVVDARAGDEAHLVALFEGFRLAGYRFSKYKSAPDDGAPPPAELLLVAPEPPAERALAPAWKLVDVALDAVATVRDLVNEPAAVKTPTYLASLAKRLGKEAGIAVEAWDPARLAREKLAGILAVARGSHEPPRLIRLHYKGAGARRHVALVGKGVTFDSGGLSLKPAKSMETMKIDMAGGATVLATMLALGRLQPAIEVTGFIPATENLPGGSAQKPGDVIRYRNGKTVEVLNTDAEGRLILADALTLAVTAKPDAVIDLATLTGACIVALGPQVAGIFGNHRPLVERLIAHGREAGELLWELPLVEDYKDDIRSGVADIKNIGGGQAGSITAALFLQEFVGDRHWAHLDIAGPAYAEKALPYVPLGGSGFGVRTLLRYLLAVAAEPAPARPAPRTRERARGSRPARRPAVGSARRKARGA